MIRRQHSLSRAFLFLGCLLGRASIEQDDMTVDGNSEAFGDQGDDIGPIQSRCVASPSPAPEIG